MRKHKGAVSVFLIIVLMANFLLGGLFVDGTRVLLAQRRVQNAMNSAARSALAGYSGTLMGQYALYGVSKEEAEKALKEYYISNLNLSVNDGLELFHFDVDENAISVSVQKPISDVKVLEEQIHEYTKYKGPVNLSIGVIEKIKSIFTKDKKQVFNAADRQKTDLEKMKNDYTECSNRINAVLGSGMKTASQNAKTQLMQDIKSVSKTQLQYMVNNADNAEDPFGFQAMAQQVNSVKTEVDKMNASQKKYEAAAEKTSETFDAASYGTASYWDEEKQAWVSESADVTKEKADAQSSPVDEAEKSKAKAQAAMQQAQKNLESNQQKIKKLINEVIALKDKIEDAEKQLKELENKNTEEEKTIQKEKEEKQKAEEERKKAEEENNQIIDGTQNIIDSSAITIPTVAQPDTPSQTEQDNVKTKEKIKELKQNIEAWNKEKDAKFTEIESCYDAIGNNPTGQYEISYSVDTVTMNEEEKQQESNAITAIRDKIQEYYDKFIGEFLKTSTGSTESGNPDFTVSSFESNSLWDNLKKIGDRAQGLCNLVTLKNTGNVILETEYIMDKCTFFTSQTSRNHHFKKAEVEYILFGNPMQITNIMAALTDIGMIRLTINFIDYLIRTQDPEPISRCVIALGRAFARTMMDLCDLILEDEGCSLCPSFPNIKLSYSDHLRLLLMTSLESNHRDDYMQRLLQMMRVTMQNQSENLDDCYTQVTITASADIDLIMMTLPMFEAILPEYLHDGKFTVKSSTTLRY